MLTFLIASFAPSFSANLYKDVRETCEEEIQGGEM